MRTNGSLFWVIGILAAALLSACDDSDRPVIPAFRDVATIEVTRYADETIVQIDDPDNIQQICKLLREARWSRYLFTRAVPTHRIRFIRSSEELVLTLYLWDGHPGTDLYDAVVEPAELGVLRILLGLES